MKKLIIGVAVILIAANVYADRTAISQSERNTVNYLMGHGIVTTERTEVELNQPAPMIDIMSLTIKHGNHIKQSLYDSLNSKMWDAFEEQNANYMVMFDTLSFRYDNDFFVFEKKTDRLAKEVEQLKDQNSWLTAFTIISGILHFVKF